MYLHVIKISVGWLTKLKNSLPLCALEKSFKGKNLASSSLTLVTRTRLTLDVPQNSLNMYEYVCVSQAMLKAM